VKKCGALLVALVAADLLVFSGYHLGQVDQHARGLAAKADQGAQTAVSIQHTR
jgi:hypothetical protein